MWQYISLKHWLKVFTFLHLTEINLFFTKARALFYKVICLVLLRRHTIMEKKVK